MKHEQIPALRLRGRRRCSQKRPTLEPRKAGVNQNGGARNCGFSECGLPPNQPEKSSPQKPSPILAMEGTLIGLSKAPCPLVLAKQRTRSMSITHSCGDRFAQQKILTGSRTGYRKRDIWRVVRFIATAQTSASKYVQITKDPYTIEQTIPLPL